MEITAPAPRPQSINAADDEIKEPEACLASVGQERLWFMDQLAPGSPFYNVPRVYQFTGPLSADNLERALGEIVKRHEALRTTFTPVGQKLYQVIHEPRPFNLRHIDMAGLPAAAQETATRRLIAAEVDRPFDLAKGPLLRAALMKVAEDDHLLIMIFHHIIADGWSMSVFARELSVLYADFHEGRPPSLAPLELQVGDAANWEHEQLAGGLLDDQLRYWTQRLADAPRVLNIATDRARPTALSYRGGSHEFQLTASLVKSLTELARAEGVTVFTIALAAFGVLLGRYAAVTDVVIGVPTAGRRRPEFEGLIGYFVNTLPIRGDLSGDPTVRELIGRIKEATLGGYANQDIPFAKVVEQLHPERDLSRNPVFQVLFQMLQPFGSAAGGNADWEVPVLDGVHVSTVEIEGRASRMDIEVSLLDAGDEVAGFWNYSTDLFESATIERMTTQYLDLLNGFATDPDAPISRFSLVTAEEERLFQEWNRTAAKRIADAPAHELFLEHARLTPEAPALRWLDTQLTYGELADRAGCLARRISAAGVGLDQRVGVYLDRGPDLIVAILAILMAGAAYVPLDPSHPRGRLKFMAEDSGCPVIVTSADYADDIRDFTDVVMTVDGTAHGDVPAGPTVRPGPGNLCYVMYTSGSTGRPKGVAMSHGALINLMSYRLRTLPAERVVGASYAAVGFDPSFTEIFVPLCSGGTVALLDDEARLDPALLWRRIREQGIQMMTVPPVILHQLAETAKNVELAAMPIVELVAAGEQFQTTAALARLGRSLPGCAFRNHYGPTETQVVTDHVLSAATDQWPGIVPVGRPFDNITVYVLDAELRRTPVGVPGELYVGGAAPARGYLNGPSRTAERYVPDPFGGVPGARMYRTGDIVRYRNDGEIEFIERSDNQVKIRGNRVELGEIEAVARRHPAVREAIAVLRADAERGNEIVLYTVADESGTPAGIRGFLRGELPVYMVPASVVTLGSLPLTPNGKVDRRALPDPVPPGSQGAGAPGVAAGTDLEKLLLSIWSEVLGRDDIGVAGNFFEFGGHSLLAMQVVLRLRDLVDPDLPLRAIFDAPTVAEMNDMLAGTGRGPAILDAS